MISSPLSNHRSYLEHIALENFKEYNQLVQKQTEEDKSNISDQYHRFRLFLSTVESLNNIPEYFFHDMKESQGWNDRDLTRILGEIRQKHKVLRDIEQIANAYKHSVRHNVCNLQAKDMQSLGVYVKLDNEKVKVDFGFDCIADETLMNEAWTFWFGYFHNQDVSILIPETESHR
ncbi:MAG: hypothetical protein CENE_02644 [Candidatus Celerinatantimonas neptuna]|nr:MAG: hypothetical protein CENE_02644 [Candidatus Celerinatantimonas neptuna]